MTQADMLNRLDELAQLEAGWLDGDGEPMDRFGLALARDVLTRATAAGMPVPLLGPDPNGSMVAHWTFGDWEVRLYFNLSAGEVEPFALNVRIDGRDDRQPLGLGDIGTAGELARFVQSYAAGAS
jgi:hypothetical protein